MAMPTYGKYGLENVVEMAWILPASARPKFCYRSTPLKFYSDSGHYERNTMNKSLMIDT